MPGSLPSGSDQSQMTPHPYSIMGGELSKLALRTEDTIRAELTEVVRTNADLMSLSTEVFKGISPELGMVAGIIEAILRRIIGAIPFWDANDPAGPAAQLLDQMNTFFTNWRGFLDNIDFSNPTLDVAAAQQQFSQNVVEPFLTAVGGVLNTFVSPGLLPLLPVSQIGDFTPNLFLNGGFDSADALNSSTNYVFDGTTGRSNPVGSAKTTADGTAKPLYSNHILVAPGQKVDLEAYVLYSGVTSGANGIQMRATPFNGDTAGTPVVIDQITPAGTIGAWHKLLGQYVTPASGVTSIVVGLRVDPTVTAGDIWWDDALAQKLTSNNLLSQDWISGLQASLAALTSLVDFNALKNTLGAGTETLAAIGNRLNFLNPDGTFDASQLVNLSNLGTIPNLLTKAPDMNAHVDNVTNALSGALTGGGTVLTNTGLTGAKETMANLFDQLSDNTRRLQTLESQMKTGAANTPSAKNYTVNFANYPDGAFPANPGGLFDLTYSGAGTSTLAISNGKAVWNLVNNGDRSAFLAYAPNGTKLATGTDFQVIRGTMSGPPGQGSNTRIWAIGRLNASGTDYVWARGYCTGFMSYKGDIGCVVGGVETVWRSNVSLTWSLDMRLVCGVGNNPKRYQVLSGESIVVDLVDGVGGFTDNSVRDANHRFWGSRSDTNGNTNPGSIAGASVYDDAPPANIQGTAFRASRRVTTDTTVASSTNGVMIPNNFFETVDYISDDLTYDPNSNCRITVKTPGTYLVTFRIFHGLYSSGNAGQGVVFKNSVREALGAIADTQFSAGFAVIVSKQDSTAFVGQVYCNAGDYLNPGYVFTASMSDTGDASLNDGAESYFCVTRVGAT